jgi:hypothetical protein
LRPPSCSSRPWCCWCLPPRLVYPAGSLREKLVLAFIWGASLTILVLGVYVTYARALEISGVWGFYHWTRGYLETVHSFQIEFARSVAKAVIGMCGALIQTDDVNDFLADSFSANTIFILYSAFGLLACAGSAFLLWRTGSIPRFLKTAQCNALFMVSLVSILFWSAFVFSYGAANPHFWLLDLFPGLFCFALGVRGRTLRIAPQFAAIALALSVFNGYFNYRSDQSSARNFPPPLLASIHEHIGDRGIFVTLGSKTWYGDMHCALLFGCLQNSSRNPGIAILDDFVLPARASDSWQEKLRGRIESTLNSGGPVFVAAHFLDSGSYADLSVHNYPFADFVEEQYSAVDGPLLYEQVRQFFRFLQGDRVRFQAWCRPLFPAGTQVRCLNDYRSRLLGKAPGCLA